jgi:hypothetical protein
VEPTSAIVAATASHPAFDAGLVRICLARGRMLVRPAALVKKTVRS